jgi:hypothetical protein
MAAINHPLGHGRRGLPLPNPVGQVNWLVVGAVALTGFAALLPVVQNSTATSTGFDIQASQREQIELQGQIGVLETDVANLTSLTRIDPRATEIGLAPVSDPIYVSVKEPGPEPAKLPAEYLPRADTRKGTPSPWWKSLTHWLP